MRFHILGLPHTITNLDYNACAYTQKVRKFAKMLGDHHEIIHYGHPDSDVPGASECVEVVSAELYQEYYGGHDFHSKFFRFQTDDKLHQEFYARSIAEIEKRKQPNDFLLPFWGCGHQAICDAHADMLVVEPGIGYTSGFLAPYKVFESYALYHAYLGLDKVSRCEPNWYEVVIPNYFDLSEFDYQEKKEDYLLFLGRVFDGKGLNIALQVAQDTGIPLKIAGQNCESIKELHLPNSIEILGYADVEQRRKLMANAKGFWLASQYAEPFGGTMVEALLSGTPIISTDWGAMTENNLHGVTGYRCRTYEQFVWAAHNVSELDSKACRQWGENFSLERIGPRYEEFFEMVIDLQRPKAWYTPKDRYELDWLRMDYPQKRESSPIDKEENFDWEQMAEEESPFAKRLASWITQKLNPSCVADIGCGPGHFVEELKAEGIKATGFDLVTHEGSEVIKADITAGPLRAYEVVMCLEVAEHIEPNKAQAVVKHLSESLANCGTLIFSSAQPGQGGVGHINCQPLEYWIELFKKHGLIHQDDLREELVSYCLKWKHMGWFVRNALVFKHDPMVSAQFPASQSQ